MESQYRISPTADNPLHVVILFYSRFGVAKLLAERDKQGVRRVPNVAATALEVEDTPLEQSRPGETQADMQLRRARQLDQLVLADAVIVGSPAYFGGMASPVKRLFEDCLVASGGLPDEDRSRPWRAPQMREKVDAAFTTSGTPHGGNEQALLDADPVHASRHAGGDSRPGRTNPRKHSGALWSHGYHGRDRGSAADRSGTGRGAKPG